MIIGSLPNNGLSEVTGIVSDTVFKNTVSESRMVTPEKIRISYGCPQAVCFRRPDEATLLSHDRRLANPHRPCDKDTSQLYV